MLELQLHNKEFSFSKIEKLMTYYRVLLSLYSKAGVEQYANQDNNYFGYFLDKMNTLLLSQEVVAIMADPESVAPITDLVLSDKEASEKGSQDERTIQDKLNNLDTDLQINFQESQLKFQK